MLRRFFNWLFRRQPPVPVPLEPIEKVLEDWRADSSFHQTFVEPKVEVLVPATSKPDVDTIECDPADVIATAYKHAGAGRKVHGFVKDGKGYVQIHSSRWITWDDADVRIDMMGIPLAEMPAIHFDNVREHLFGQLGIDTSGLRPEAKWNYEERLRKGVRQHFPRIQKQLDMEVAQAKVGVMAAEQRTVRASMIAKTILNPEA